MIGFFLINVNDLKNSMSLIKRLSQIRQVYLIVNCKKIRENWMTVDQVMGLNKLGCNIVKFRSPDDLKSIQLQCCFMGASCPYILNRDLGLKKDSIKKLGKIYGLGWGWDTFKESALKHHSLFRSIFIESESFLNLRKCKYDGFCFGHPYYDFSHLDANPYEKYDLPKNKSIALLLHTFSMKLSPEKISVYSQRISNKLRQYGYYVVFKHKNNLRLIPHTGADKDIVENNVDNLFSTIEIGRISDAFVIPCASRVFAEGILCRTPIVMGNYSMKKSFGQLSIFKSFCDGIEINDLSGDLSYLKINEKSYEQWINKWFVFHPQGNTQYIIETLGL